MTDWMDDPEAREWAQHVLDEMLPMLRDSALTVSLVPEDSNPTDVKFAVELGMSIMLDKPIILAVPAGVALPDHLVRVADSIVEYDRANPDSMRRIAEEAARVLEERQ